LLHNVNVTDVGLKEMSAAAFPTRMSGCFL
jgi:hypothetical protein